LEVVNAGTQPTKSNLLRLMCIVESNPYNRLLDFYSFEWHEIIFNSRILLPYKTNDIVTRRSFW